MEGRMWGKVPRSVSYSSLILASLVVYALFSTFVMQSSLLSSYNSSTSGSFLQPHPGQEPIGVIQPSQDRLQELLTKDLSCPVHNSSLDVRPFGSFREIPEGACALALTSTSFPKKVLQDFDGYRLPFYGPDAARIYRCYSFVVGATGSLTSNDEKLDEAIKNCTVSGDESDIVRLFALKASVEPTQIRLLIEEWLKNSSEGIQAMEAIRRATSLQDTRMRRRFSLIAEQHEWKALLASGVGQQAFPDVNTHLVELPPTSMQTMLVQNGRTEKNGRTSTENMEVFYPKRAPYSHVALMENKVGSKMHQFSTSQNGRVSFGEKVKAEFGYEQSCRGSIQIEHQVYSCDSHGPRTGTGAVAVSKVLVTSQTLGSQMFHYLCENLPRLGLYIDFLQANPDVHIHAACPKNAGYCLPLLELLGINRSRVITGQPMVYSKKALVPEGGRRHWPLGNLWGLMSLRDAVLSRHFSFPSDSNHRVYCNAVSTDGQGEVLIAKVAIIRRTLTRLREVNGQWYDRIAAGLAKEPGFYANFKVRLELRLFDDRDKAIMSEAYAQIKQMREADVVIGAHGAAMSWITYAQPCTHFISFRSRVNSDIFEHLSLGMGVPFHHILFKGDYDSLYRDLKRNVGVAISEMIRNVESHETSLFLAIICEDCDTEAAERLLHVFHLVFTKRQVRSKDSAQKIVVIEEQVDCITGYRERILKYVETNFGKEKLKNTFWGWVENSKIMVNPQILSYWVPLRRFDGLLLTDSLTASMPQLAIFKSHVSFGDSFCSSSSLFNSIDTKVAGDLFALIVSGFKATATSTDGRTFHLAESSVSELEQLEKATESHGPTELFTKPEYLDHKPWPGFFVVLKTDKSSTWRYRYPPLGSLMRTPPSPKTLGHPGHVRLVQTPIAKVSDVICTIPKHNLDEGLEIQC